MKVSELITSLEHMKDTYGDLQVSVSLSAPNEDIINDNNLFVEYDQMDDTDQSDINIRNFPY